MFGGGRCPNWVQTLPGGMSALSPFYPQLRTLVGAVGTAEKCQFRTRAAQQRTALFHHLIGARGALIVNGWI